MVVLEKVLQLVVKLAAVVVSVLGLVAHPTQAVVCLHLAANPVVQGVKVPVVQAAVSAVQSVVHQFFEKLAFETCAVSVLLAVCQIGDTAVAESSALL